MTFSCRIFGFHLDRLFNLLLHFFSSSALQLWKSLGLSQQFPSTCVDLGPGLTILPLSALIYYYAVDQSFFMSERLLDIGKVRVT